LKRNKFNLSRYILSSAPLGRLFPINWAEVLPGDTFQGNTTALVRVMPLVAPVMHPVQFTIHHWFVPWRLVWSGWEDFIVRVNDTSVFLPFITAPTTAGTAGEFPNITDYFGIQRQPVGSPAPKLINALPIRAYNKIWNEFYRDQDLSTPVLEDQVVAQPVFWSKDRFSMARTTLQKGAAVTVPVGGPINVQTLRNAFAAQKFREARSRYGSRYVEYLRYLGVTPADARLDRPEFLGGGTQTIQFGEVVQTAPTAGAPLGSLGGHGVSAVRTNAFRRYFDEHGLMLTLAFMRPVPIYGTGAERLFNKTNQDDFHNRELEHIGQQEIFNHELFVAGAAADATVFGYQDRYDEYRHTQSRATGTFTSNSNAGGSIGVHYPWSFSRNFASGAPPLNAALFAMCIPRTEPFAQATYLSAQFACMSHHKLIARRMVSKNGNPRLAL